MGSRALAVAQRVAARAFGLPRRDTVSAVLSPACEARLLPSTARLPGRRWLHRALAASSPRARLNHLKMEPCASSRGRALLLCAASRVQTLPLCRARAMALPVASTAHSRGPWEARRADCASSCALTALPSRTRRNWPWRPSPAAFPVLCLRQSVGNATLVVAWPRCISAVM